MWYLSLQAEAGYRTSAGVACNKMLSKLVSGLHKPDDQTVLPPPAAAAFIAPLKPRRAHQRRCMCWAAPHLSPPY
jgi:nucleotidyltransferase/DNA polymerase involved in DNA repair